MVRYHTRTITPHWLRVSHPATRLQSLRSRLIDLFGQPDQIRGKWFFEHGERFSNGVLLMWGTIVGNKAENELEDDQGICCVDVSGSVLDSMETQDRIAFCVEMSLGGRVTRLDLAVDAFHDISVGMIDLVTKALERGQQIGSKVWEPKIKYNSGQVVAYGVNIGLRGKDGSGRYIRVYDKGLEQQDAPIGQHERFEVEFSGDAAAEAAADVLRSVDDWETRAWNRVNGSVAFRELGGPSDRHLDRRPMLAWWSKWIEGSAPLPTVPRRQETTLERHTRWLVNTVMPTTARLAKAAKVSFTDALYHLCGPEIKPRSDDKYMRSMLEEWRDMLQGRPWIAAT